MSAIGMRHLVFAPVTNETPGTSITYGSGVAVDHAVRGDQQYAESRIRL